MFSLRVNLCYKLTSSATKKNCENFICVTLQLVKQEKNKRNFSIRLPEDVIALLDEIAANTGLNITRNNVVEQACEWFVRTYQSNGNRALTEADMRDLENYLREKLSPSNQNFSRIILNEAKDHGDSMRDPSDELDGGSNTAKTPAHYKKATRQKLAS